MMLVVGRAGAAARLLGLCKVHRPAIGMTRWVTMEGVREFPEREKAAEAVYFNKEEEKLLRGVLKKIKMQADKIDKHAAAGQVAEEKSALKEILGKYNVSDRDMEELLKWKHHN